MRKTAVCFIGSGKMGEQSTDFNAGTRQRLFDKIDCLGRLQTDSAHAGIQFDHDADPAGFFLTGGIEGVQAGPGADGGD